MYVICCTRFSVVDAAGENGWKYPATRALTLRDALCGGCCSQTNRGECACTCDVTFFPIILPFKPLYKQAILTCITTGVPPTPSHVATPSHTPVSAHCNVAQTPHPDARPMAASSLHNPALQHFEIHPTASWTNKYPQPDLKINSWSQNEPS